MQEQSKASLPRAAAVYPLDSSVPTGPSLVSSLTMADIEAVIQMVAFPHLLFGKISPRFFTVKLVGFIGFLGSSYLVLFIFPLHDFDMILIFVCFNKFCSY